MKMQLVLCSCALAFAVAGCGGQPASGPSSAGPVTVSPPPGSSLADAVSSLPANGGTINLSAGIYKSGFDNGSVLTKPNVKIDCSGMPSLNNSSDPTSLVGGTIIQGEVDVAGYSSQGSAAGFEMHNCGIDVGKSVVDSLYAGTPHNGLAITNVGQVAGVPQTGGVVVDHLIVLGYENDSPVHAMLFENLTGANLSHLDSYLNGIGQVFKVMNSRISDVHCSGETHCAYIKSNAYAPAGNDTLDGLNASFLSSPGDTGGLSIDSQSASIDSLQISNLTFTGTTVGISGLFDRPDGFHANDVSISGFQMDDSDIPAASRTAPCFFFYTSGSSTANNWTIHQASCNNVSTAVWMTSNDSWTNIQFSNLNGENFASGNGMILSGTVSVNQTSLAGLGSGFGILAEGTDATAISVCNFSVNAGATPFRYVYIASKPTISVCPAP